jgi:hypothetical protein
VALQIENLKPRTEVKEAGIVLKPAKRSPSFTVLIKLGFPSETWERGLGYGHQFVEGVMITYFYEPEVGKFENY